MSPHHAAVGIIEPGEACQQGRLPRSRGPRHGHQLVGRDRQRHPSQRERFVVPRVEETEKIAGIEHRGCHVHEKPSVTIIHGSTLSDPAALDSVTAAALPSFQNT